MLTEKKISVFSLIISFSLIAIFCTTWESVFSFAQPNELRIDQSGLLSTIYFTSKGFENNTTAQLGIDYIFPYGPLLFWKYYLFWPGLYWAGLFFKSIFFFSYALALNELYRRNSNYSFLSILPIILVTIWMAIHAGKLTGSEGIYYSYFIMLGFIFFGNKNKVNKLNTLIFSLSIAVLALSKFTFLLISLILITLLLVENVKERKNQIFALLSILIFIIFWKFLCKQDIINLPNYFLISLSYSAHFAKGMSIGWIDFTSIGAVISIIILMIATWLVTKRSSKYHINIILTLYISILFYLIFKHGFTRADGHITHFASPIIFIFIFYITFFYREIKTINYINYKNLRIIKLKYLLLIPVTLSFFMINYYAPIISTKYSNDNYLKHIISLINHQIKAPLKMFSYNKEYTELFDLQVDNFKKSVGLNVPEGETVDAWPDNAALAIFSNGTYSPRPHPYAFSSYTKELTHKNAQYIRSDKAPNYLFFEINTHDNHLPSNDDPLTLIEIFKNYEISSISDQRYLLKKRVKARDLIEISSGKIFAKVYEEIILPKTNNVLIIDLKIEKNIFGKLFNLFYKLPQMQLVTKNDKNEEQTFRYVPEVEKFILSPKILKNEDAKYLFNNNQMYTNVNKINQVRLVHRIFNENTSKFMKLFYKKEIEVSYEEVIFD